MDQKIYYPTAADLGIYATRRYPKGRGAPVGNPTGPTEPDNPNANPSTLVLKFATALLAGPSIDVMRFTYTVPPRRKAVIESAEVEFSRAVAGAGNAMSYALVYLKRADQPKIELVRVTSHNDAAGANDRMLHTGEVHLFEGDTLEGWTSISSGSAAFSIYVNGIEYDATHRVIGGEHYIGQFEGLNGGSGAYAAKFPTAYSMALTYGYTEQQARFAGDTGRLPTADSGYVGG